MLAFGALRLKQNYRVFSIPYSFLRTNNEASDLPLTRLEIMMATRLEKLKDRIAEANNRDFAAFCATGNLEKLERLYGQISRPIIRRELIHKALTDAASRGDLPLFTFLCETACTPASGRPKMQEAFYYASKSGELPLLQYIYENYWNEIGSTWIEFVLSEIAVFALNELNGFKEHSIAQWLVTLNPFLSISETGELRSFQSIDDVVADAIGKRHIPFVLKSSMVTYMARDSASTESTACVICGGVQNFSPYIKAWCGGNSNNHPYCISCFINYIGKKPYDPCVICGAPVI